MLLSTLAPYDIFLVDAYGVFWDGRGVIAGTRDMLHGLMEAGKKVVILSNTTQLSAVASKKYTEHDLHEGVHYHALVTSGDVMRKSLEQGLGMGADYYNFGTKNAALFAGLDYKMVPLASASFIYIGVPQLTEYTDKYKLHESYSLLPDGAPCWDSTDIEAFSALLEPLIASKLPVVNANPDMTAPEKCKASNTLNKVIRQGSIAARLEEAGLAVHQFGKPYSEIYAFCRELLITRFGINPNTLKTAMIGDTLATDILGAKNATEQLGWPVDGVLTLTGNTEKENLEAQYVQAGCMPHKVITSFGIDGREVNTNALSRISR